MAKRNSTSSGHRPPPRSVALTDVGPDLLALCLAHLPPPALLDLATTSRLFAAAVRLNVRGVAVGLRQRSPGSRGSAPAPAGLSPAVDRLALISPAAANAAGSAPAAAAQAAAWDPNESRLWQAGGPRLRPVTAAWHLRRALAARGAGAGAGGAVPAPRRQLALVLAAPEMDASDVELCRLLAAAGAEGTIDAVAVPQGLLRLAGGLNARLTAANVVAAGLPSALQASAPYTRLQRLTLKLSPDDDLPAILASVHPGTLPALRCLALLAGAPAGAAADLSALRHPALRRLDLRGVQLPAGFASLRHLTGLHALAVRFEEEEEAPPLNLQGDLTALSALKQLSSLSLDCLALGDGFTSLPHLTSLSLAPQQGASITLCGLPRLARLSVDLSLSGSSGRDLLSAVRSSVHVPPGHGLSSLQHLELRCFVWRNWRAEGDDDGTGSTDSSGSEASGSKAGSEESGSESSSEAGSSAAGSGEAGSSAAGGSELDSASSASGWDSSSLASDAGEASSGDDEEQEEVEEAGAAEAMADDIEGEEEAESGLLQASWGFLQQNGGSADGDQEEQAHPMAALEQRYIAALLARLPTLTSIQLTDYMGVVDPASLLPATTTPGTVAAAASQGKPAAAAAGPGAGKEALAAGSRAATPGLVLQQGGAAPGEGGAAAATGLGGGWRRTLAEAPVPGGISQFDVAYSFDP